MSLALRYIGYTNIVSNWEKYNILIWWPYCSINALNLNYWNKLYLLFTNLYTDFCLIRLSL